MKSTSMYTAVLALSLAMALAGGGLACRTFRERLDALEEQAVLQHQRNVCGLEDAFAAESGLHVHGLLRDPELFEPFPPESVGAVRRLGVGAKSGGAAIGAALDRLAPAGGGAPVDAGLMGRVRRAPRSWAAH